MLGSTRDDAAGEAFDKVACGLPYDQSTHQVLTSALDLLACDVDHNLISVAKKSAVEIGNVTKKLQGICRYQTKEHIDGTEILDIDASIK